MGELTLHTKDFEHFEIVELLGEKPRWALFQNYPISCHRLSMSYM